MKTKFIIPKINVEQDESDIAVEVGVMVQEARVLLGITQTQLAERLGTKQSSIARLENGSSLPSISFLFRIAKACQTSLIPPKLQLVEDFRKQYEFVHESEWVAQKSIPVKPIKYSHVQMEANTPVFSYVTYIN